MTTSQPPLVTVIIPVYNTEQYLPRCLDSILTQSYTNLDILLINDGSTDSTPAICDHYAAKDSRIRLIHQDNKGIAETRNIGIKQAIGQYIQFVDADDWIEPQTIETCLKLSQAYNVNTVSYHSIKEYSNGFHKATSSKQYPPTLLDTADALSLLFFAGYVGLGWVNKLFRAEILRGIECPVGRVWEDTYTMFKVVEASGQVLSTSNKFYHYFMRSNSISHTDTPEAIYFISDSGQECFDFVTQHYTLNKTQYRNISVGFWMWRMWVIHKMMRSGLFNNDYIQALRRDIKTLDVLTCPHINFTTKFALLVLKLSPKIYNFIYIKFRRKV